MPCTYKITFPDGKAYIGATSDLDARVARHVQNATQKPDLEISKAIRYYGVQNLRVEVLFYSENLDDVYLSERLCIIAFGTKYPRGLNLTDGGKGLDGVKYREEHAEKRSAVRKSVWADPEYKAKMSALRTGRKQSEETKRRRSEAVAKVWADPEYKARLRESHAKRRQH